MHNTRYSCHILMKFEFSRHIFENINISNFMKIRQMEIELFHVLRPDGESDMTKLIVAFRSYANASKIAPSSESVAPISLSYKCVVEKNVSLHGLNRLTI